ncbi:hypothetical protein QUB60_10485 [Microcoleus sp. A2-C5]|uniref:hypothetical protein n=1 Tax=Microcoleaceae TaxID=1892252 RepID=UPI002237F19D|nr:hypothetical protein [Lyngbya sp. CCAP 1446/10]MCW6049212.1 hypothetical protein [Lyngbya sp. CCAP 1446/10]
MEPILTHAEMNEKRMMLQDYAPAQAALAILEKHNGRLDMSFDELWAENNNDESFTQPKNGKSLWQVTLKTLRAELCGNDGLRAQFKDYTKNPGSTPLLTGLIVAVVGLGASSGIPIDPSIATIVVLYLLKIGLNIFCEYTEPVS